MILGYFMKTRYVIEELQKEKLSEVGSTQSSIEKIITCQEQSFILRDKRIVPGQLRGEILHCVHETQQRPPGKRENSTEIANIELARNDRGHGMCIKNV